MGKIGTKINKLFKYERQSVTRTVRLVIWALLIFFLIAFAFAFISTTERTEKDYESRQSETIINNTSSSIEANIDNYTDISRLLLLNETVTKYLKAIYPDVGLHNDARFGVMDVLNVCRNLDSVVIIRNDYNFMNTGRGLYDIKQDELTSSEWKEKIVKEKGGALVLMNGGGTFYRKDGAPIISIARAFYDIHTQKHIGYMLINFTTGMLDRLITYQNRSSVCIISTDGEYLAGNEELCQYMSDEFKTNNISHKTVGLWFNHRMISGKTMENLPIVIICETKASTQAMPTEFIISFIILMVTFLASIFFTRNFMLRNFTTPIVNLSDAMEKTKESGWIERVSIDPPNNEIGILADSYNSMIDYMNDLFKQLLENEQEIQRAEMSVLHEQIKPHFLYNSLECINCMAMDEGATNVQKAIATLGNFYRNSLSKGSREIPLSREIRIVQDYLYLQRLRYGDVLIDEYHLDERTLDLVVPKLILQPLVENSIYHGIRLKGEEGIISITSRLMDDGLHLYVYDTGIGMDEETINKVLSKDEPIVDNPSTNVLSGFGLKGTIQRLRYYCGSDNAVKIRSELGEYTEIEITVPVKNVEQNKND